MFMFTRNSEKQLVYTKIIYAILQFMVRIETIVIEYLLTQSSCMDNPTVR